MTDNIRERDERWQRNPSTVCPDAHLDHATLLAEVARLCKENERLRLALENIASGDYSDPHFPQWYAEESLRPPLEISKR